MNFSKIYVDKAISKLIEGHTFENVLVVSSVREALERSLGLSITGLKALAIAKVEKTAFRKLLDILYFYTYGGVRGGVLAILVLRREEAAEIIYLLKNLKLSCIVFDDDKILSIYLDYLSNVSEAAEEPIFILYVGEKLSLFSSDMHYNGIILPDYPERSPTFNKHWFIPYRWNYLNMVFGEKEGFIRRKRDNFKVLVYYFSLLQEKILGKFPINASKKKQLVTLAPPCLETEKDFYPVYPMNPPPLNFFSKLVAQGLRLNLLDYDPPIYTDSINNTNHKIRVHKTWKINTEFFSNRVFRKILHTQGGKRAFKINGSFSLLSLAVLRNFVEILQESFTPITVGVTSLYAYPESGIHVATHLVTPTVYKIANIGDLFDIVTPPSMVYGVYWGLVDSGYREGPIILILDKQFFDSKKVNKIVRRGGKIIVIWDNSKVKVDKWGKVINLDYKDYAKTCRLLFHLMETDGGKVIFLKPSLSFKSSSTRKAVIINRECDTCLECVNLNCKGIILKENGYPTVIQDFCRGCGACYVTCKRGAIEITNI